MSALSNMNPLFGIEYDWFCTDSEGYIGVFTTAGQGPIPLAIKNNWEQYNNLQNYITSLRLSSSYIVEVKDVIDSTGFVRIGESPIPNDAVAQRKYKDWFKYASQGLYAFDWRDVHRHHSKSNKYELVARPTTSLNIASVPLQAREFLESIIIMNMTLKSIEMIDVTRFWDCSVF